MNTKHDDLPTTQVMGGLNIQTWGFDSADESGQKLLRIDIFPLPNVETLERMALALMEAAGKWARENGLAAGDPVELAPARRGPLQ